VAKEIDHVLIDGCWRMTKNCRVYRSAQFLNTNHRFVVATLRLQLKSGIMVPFQPQMDVGKLKDERAVEEFVNRLSEELWGLSALWNPEKLWSAFKTTILDVSSGCLRTHQKVKKNFVSQEILDTIGQSCRASLNGRAELFRELRRKTVRGLRVDKEAYVREICEGVEHQLWSSDTHPPYRGIHALRPSNPIPRCTAVGAEGGSAVAIPHKGPKKQGNPSPR